MKRTAGFRKRSVNSPDRILCQRYFPVRRQHKRLDNGPFRQLVQPKREHNFARVHRHELADGLDEAAVFVYGSVDRLKAPSELSSPGI